MDLVSFVKANRQNPNLILMFIAIWKYVVDPQFLKSFEKLYGPSGAWVQSFKTGDGYLGTELMRLSGHPNVYLTSDKWESKDQYHNFYKLHQKLIDEIDQQGDTMTLWEEKLGWFEQSEELGN